MAILQALFALITKSAGKILNAIFGWAVRALFGRTSAKERTFLSGLVAAAAAWPLLFVGMIAPKLAAMVLAFVPIPNWVPSWTVRLVWLALAILVPLAIGIAMAAKAPPEAPRLSWIRRLLSGFPITVGLASAFMIMFVTVPLMRLWALLRGQQTADVPLITEAKGYHQMAALTVGVLNKHGFELHPAEPGWWVVAPARVLRFFGGDAFAAFIPKEIEHFERPDLAISFYPSGVLLRGKGKQLPWAHGLIAEATAQGEGFQTTAPEAQGLEKQIKRLWKLYSEEPRAHRDSALLGRRLDEVAAELATVEVEFDDWQVLYRQLLQTARALHGNKQLLEKQASEAGYEPHDREHDKAHAGIFVEVAVTNNEEEIKNSTVGPKARELSTVELVKEITGEVGRLAQKQIELAKTELKADLKAEVTTISGLGVAALTGLATVNLLLVTLVFALAQTMPGWAAGLLVSAVTLAFGGVVGLWAWSKRVKSPLARTRRTVKDDVQFTKERLV